MWLWFEYSNFGHFATGSVFVSNASYLLLKSWILRILFKTIRIYLSFDYDIIVWKPKIGVVVFTFFTILASFIMIPCLFHIWIFFNAFKFCICAHIHVHINMGVAKLFRTTNGKIGPVISTLLTSLCIFWSQFGLKPRYCALYLTENGEDF